MLVSAENIGAYTRLLNFEIQQEPLGFAGGQYIIVHTGAPEIAGKAVKRAYSILSSDREQARVQIAVRRIGPGSDSMHALPVGGAMSFSGPWGKYRSDGTPGAATRVGYGHGNHGRNGVGAVRRSIRRAADFCLDGGIG